jgi:hypothetical protein
MIQIRLIAGVLLLIGSSLIALSYSGKENLASVEAGILSQSAPEKESLKQLRGVSVVVEQVKPNVQHIITSEQARAIIEARLRANNVPILSEDEAFMTTAAGHLYLKLKILKTGSTNAYSYSWQLQLLQRVRLDRDPSFRMLAPTWNRDDMGFAPGAAASSDLKQGIRDLVDRFCMDYQANN